MDNDDHKPEEHGAEQEQCTVVTVVYNHATCEVSLGLRDVKIGLAQMMIHEAATQLEYMRRQAATMEMLQQRANAAQAAAIAEELSKRR